MKVQLTGGPFDGQEVELTEPANEIPSDGGTYRAATTQPMTSPDGLRVAGAVTVVFEFVPDEDADVR